MLALFPAMGSAATGKFTIPAASVTASADDGNVPGNTVDGSLDTRWSASGDGQWITFDLGENKKVAYIKIAFLNGSTRTSTFDIQTSTNNTTFVTAQAGVVSALSDGLQTFDFPDVDPARYVRIVGHGNSNSAWNSYTEVEIYGDASGSPSEPITPVSTSAQLVAAIGSAAPGTTIVLANGTYTQSGSFSVSGKNGTAANPITIKAANTGQAIISGSANFNISNSSYITLQGLKFANTGSTALTLNASNHIRVTRNTFDLTEDGTAGLKWLIVQGTGSGNNQIDHNEFGPRQDLGVMIAFQGGDGQISQHDVIENNYFHDAASQTANGGETIRLGLSGISMSDGDITIQNNLFVNCDSDAEILSVKSGHNTIRYNTFINNKGQVTARHGHGNSYYGNFILGNGTKAGVGGFRIYGNDQKIYNNYLENLTSSALEIGGGDFDAGPNGANYTNADLTAHWRVYRAEVVNNTIVNSSSGIYIGKSYTYAPVDSKVANNIVKGTTGPLYNEVRTSNTVFAGNIGYGATLDNVSRTAAEIKNVNPLFTTVNNLQKLSSTSPAIDAAVGTYSYMTDDMDGQLRSANDTGADEYSTAAITRRPLTTADVGPAAP